MSATENEITISHNYWRVPSVQGAFSGILEGIPTPEQRREMIEAAEAARTSWKPSPEGMQLVERLKFFVGYRIRLQFWDSIMWMCEEEAPFPVHANCIGVMLLQDGDFLQAYIEVSNLQEYPTVEGYSPQGYFQKKEGSDNLLAPLADIYSVSKVVTL